MKKIYLSFAALALAGGLSAQSRSSQILWSAPSSINRWFSEEKAPNDTLFPPVRPGCTDSIFIYVFTGGSNGTGFVSGTNSWGDLEKGQAFTATMAAKVTDVIVPAVHVTGNGNYTAKVYAVSNDTVIGAVLGQSAPTNLQTPNVYVFPITSPPSVPNATKFMVSVTVKAAAGDTIVVPTTAFGCGNRESFEMWDNNQWFVMETVYGQDIDIILGAVLMDNASLQNLEDFTSLVYPTPARDFVTLSAGIRKSGNYTLHIYNAHGALVEARNLGMIPQGSFVSSLDLSGYASGIYSYRIFSNETISSGRLIKK